VRIREALLKSARQLRSSGVAVPEMTARVLLSDVLGRDQAWLEAHSDEAVGPGRLERFRSALRARADGVPLQYIRGVQEFFGLEFAVTPAVLIPRPETEHLVEAALQRIRPGDRVVDIGTGSGAIAVSLALNAPSATVLASDISLDALAVASRNAARLGAEVQFLAADAGRALAPKTVEMVVSNPPYVPRADACGLQKELHHEPAVALYGGEDGLQVFERIARSAWEALRRGGWLLAEIGFGSRGAVRRLLQTGGWEQPAFLGDLAGIDRVVITRRRA